MEDGDGDGEILLLRGVLVIGMKGAVLVVGTTFVIDKEGDGDVVKDGVGVSVPMMVVLGADVVMFGTNVCTSS